MIPTNEQVAARFPDWDEKERAAYRRGVSYFDAGGEIGEHGPDGGAHPCFLRGYADAMGEDAEFTDWWDGISDDWAIDHCWWVANDEENESD